MLRGIFIKYGWDLPHRLQQHHKSELAALSLATIPAVRHRRHPRCSGDCKVDCCTLGVV